MRHSPLPLLLALLLAACGGTNPTVCDAGQNICSGACADLRLDNQNCGACAHACGAEEACAGSKCYPRACGNQTCAEGLACVDGVCADRACFAVTCETGQRCAGGACYAQTCGSQTCSSSQVCVDNACADAACVGVLCPAGLKCANGICFADTCGDGLKSGAETDSDCGGPVCAPCNSGQHCTVPLDCGSKVCAAMSCAAPSCTDNVRNGLEGDVDCGGACPLCDDGKTCAQASQCSSGSCAAGRCAAAACTDGLKNGTETDRDCGGGCPKCAEGLACLGAADCVTSNCSQMRCVSSMCLDGAKNGSETDVDCGSNCAPCIDGKICAAGMDCLSGVCSAAMRCVAPNCTDLVKNGLETDLDCGGPCMACGAGRKCKVGNDCLSKSCQNMTCVAPSCSDGIANGVETDIDCGGATGGCIRCAPTKNCLVPGDCASGGCTMMKCDAPLLFWAPVVVPTGTNPRGLTITDVDNDGLPDLLSANYDTYDVSLMYQQLDGGLTPALTLQVSTNPNIRGPTSVAVADLNSDGFNDLLVPRNSVFAGSNYTAYAGCRIGILKGLGNRQFLGATDSEFFAEHSGCGWTAGLARLNPDPLIDIIVSDGLDGIGGAGQPRGTGGDSWGAWSFNQAGDGGFAIPPAGYLDAAGPHIAIGDVNNDGKPDVVGHSNRVGQVRTFLGMGDGNFMAPSTFGVGAGFGAIVLGNFNGDNNLDIAVASEGGGTIAVAIGLGDGQFIAPVSYAVPTPYALSAADINGDGKLDLVVGTTGIAVLYGNGDGTFLPQQTVYASVGRVYVLATGDLNGDSHPDVVVIPGAPGAVRLLINRP